MSVNLDPPTPVSNADELLKAVQQRPQEWLEFLQRISNFSTNAQEMIVSLEQELAVTKSSLDEANVTIADAQANMATGQLVLNELRSNLATVSAQSNKSQRSTKHPDPPLYGGDKSELRGWMTQLRIKLNINSDHYPTEQSKLAYALGRLKEKALEQLQPYLKENGTIDLADMGTFYNKLQLAFGDPDRKATAQRELRQLKQKDREFYLYLSDYQRLVPDTGYDDEAKRSILLDGLSDELKSALITVDLPASLDDTINVLQKIDNRFRSVQASLRKPFAYGTTRSSSAPSIPTPKVSSGTSTPGTSTPAPRPTPPSSSEPDVMDLSTSRRRGPITPAERSRRMNEGLCMYCGGSGHFANSCPASKGKSRIKTYELSSVASEEEEKAQSPA